ncbi:hypothetical protein V6N13_002942 [Hibiscus sabdariffa]|uniref:Pectinesterase inhibitor domain-containing protein n=1 Tax=Hibiscus sabdariffa TaxID=183260 RepID=A0ABR2NXS5_9ROSI
MYHTSGRSKILFVVASISALVLLLFSLIGLLEESTGNTHIHRFHVTDHLRHAYSACQGTLYPDLCIAVVSVVPDFTSKPLLELISTILNRTMYEVTLCSANCANIEKRLRRNNTERAAINDCLELFNHTLAELTVASADLSRVSGNHHELRTFLSAAMTNQYTCLDGLDGSIGNTKNIIEKVYTTYLITSATLLQCSTKSPVSPNRNPRLSPSPEKRLPAVVIGERSETSIGSK